MPSVDDFPKSERVELRHDGWQIDLLWEPTEQSQSPFIEIIDVKLELKRENTAQGQSSGHTTSKSISTLGSLITDYWTQFGPDDSLLLKLVIPARDGFAARGNAFRDRLLNFHSVLRFVDRSESGRQYRKREAHMSLTEILDLSVCMILISPSQSSVSVDISRELQFPFLLDSAPKRKKVAMFNGRKNAEAAKPILETARDLGITLLILDHPGHWLLESPYTHLFETFVPMDMSFDEDLPHRIVAAVQDHLPLDGIFTVSDPCLVAVAKAASLLDLPTQPIRAFEMSVDKSQSRALNTTADTQFVSTSSKEELQALIESSRFIPQYPLIVKPSTGWSSESVFKVQTTNELLHAASGIPSRPANPKILVETYVDGPEVDANFVLCDGELLFFEASDDFPCAADESDAGYEADFYEQANVLPSALPRDELESIRSTLLQILLDVGFHTGVFHLEARVKHSAMEYTEEDGVLDLRSKHSNPSSSVSPTCFLIEINPRPPGFQSLYATRLTYGIDYIALHLLSCLQDTPRIHTLSSHPTRPSTSPSPLTKKPKNNNLWCQIVFIANTDRHGGICSTTDPYNTLLTNHPHLAPHIAMGQSFFNKGDYVPPLTADARGFLAFFLVTSRKGRGEVLSVAKEIRGLFRVELERDEWGN